MFLSVFRRIIVLVVASAIGAGLATVGKKYVFPPENPPAVAVAEKKSAPALERKVSESVGETERKAVAPGDGVQSAPLWISGYAVRERKINVVLSDGRILSEGDDSLGQVWRTHAIVDGVKVYRKPYQKPAAAIEGLTAPGVSVVPKADQFEGRRSETVAAQGEASSSWVMGSDGVQRLRAEQRIGEGYSGIAR